MRHASPPPGSREPEDAAAAGLRRWTTAAAVAGTVIVLAVPLSLLRPPLDVALTDATGAAAVFVGSAASDVDLLARSAGAGYWRVQCGDPAGFAAALEALADRQGQRPANGRRSPPGESSHILV